MTDIETRLNKALAEAESALGRDDGQEDGVQRGQEALARGRLPALKVPDPAFVLKRLEEGRSAGLLARRRCVARVGDAQALVGSKGGKAQVFGVVSQGGPAPVASLGKLEKSLRAGIDKATRSDFDGVQKSLYYIPLRLLAKFDPPLRLRREPLGKRFCSVVDLATDVELDAPTVDEFMQEPTAERLALVSDEALAGLRLELREVHKTADDNEQREDALNAHAFVLSEAGRREFDLDLEDDEPFLTETLLRLEMAARSGNDDAAEVVKRFSAMQPGGALTSDGFEPTGEGCDVCGFGTLEDVEKFNPMQPCPECGVVMVAVLKQAPRAGMSREQLEAARNARSRQFGIEVLSTGSALTFPSGFPTDLRLYGDPVNLKYPVETQARASNARVRFKQFASAYKKAKSKAVVHERIIRAELKFGITPSFDPDDPLDALLPGALKDKLRKDVSKQMQHMHDIPGGGQTGPARETAQHTHQTPDGVTGPPVVSGPEMHVHELPSGNLTGPGIPYEPEAEPAEGRCGGRDKERRGRKSVRLLKRDTASDTGGEKEERFVFGVVLVPGEVDAQGETYTAEEVRKAAHFFMEQSGGQFKVMHKGRPVDGVTVLETYLTKQEEAHGGETLPEWTWLMGVRVSDDELWAAVQAGQFTGFSIGGTALREQLQ